MSTRRRVLAVTALSLSAAAGCLEDTVPDDLAERLPGGREGPDDSEARRDILTDYEAALEARNAGIEVRDRGIEHFNVEAYAEAIEAIETALDDFIAAEEGFEDAMAGASDLDLDRVHGICADAAENTRLQVAATEAGLEASTAADEGADADSINESIMTYQERVEEAEGIPVADGETVAEELGF